MSSPTTGTAGSGHAGVLTVTKFKYIQTENMRKISKSSEKHFASEKIKDSAGNLYSVLSWARWYLLPHWASELNALTRSPCSVSRTCFNCKSKRLWYEMCWAGNDKAEQGQYSSLIFDRGTWKYQKSRGNSEIFFFFLQHAIFDPSELHPADINDAKL